MKNMKNKALIKQLIALKNRDQKMRRLGKYNVKVDRANTVQLKKIIKQYGWPTLSLVGKDGTEAAWLIVQHADFDVRFQEACLRLMKAQIPKKEISLHHIAYLTDRILVNRGKKQIFGTQFYKNNQGQLVPRLIKDIKLLDKRRKEFNLPPFQTYKNLMEKLYK